jgi:alpha-mannosidase
MALPGAMTDVYRGVGMCLERTEARRLESPEMVEFRGPGVRTTLLAGGLPYHRRAGDSQLDTLLIVRGETQRQFRLGIGLDLSHPQTAVLDALCPLLCEYQTAPPPRLPSAWLFHIDARNVIATHWETVTTEDGRVSGVRVRLLETGGRAVSCGFHFHRTLTAARRLDFSGSALGELQVDGEKVIIDMAPGQWVQLEVEWP